MIKKKFTRIIEFIAIQFNPKDPEWHHSIQRVTINGKIPDFESYNCIIPCDHILSIRPGDWIIIDDMNNATGVLDQHMMKDISESDTDFFEIADQIIAKAYPDSNNKGKGFWGDKRIPNYGILRGAIEEALRNNESIKEKRHDTL